MTLGMLEGYSGEPTGTYNNVPFLIEKGMIEKSSAISVRFEIMGALSRRYKWVICVLNQKNSNLRCMEILNAAIHGQKGIRFV